MKLEITTYRQATLFGAACSVVSLLWLMVLLHIGIANLVTLLCAAATYIGAICFTMLYARASDGQPGHMCLLARRISDVFAGLAILSVLLAALEIIGMWGL